jgi:hypothetical protein
LFWAFGNSITLKYFMTYRTIDWRESWVQETWNSIKYLVHILGEEIAKILDMGPFISIEDVFKNSNHEHEEGQAFWANFGL